MLEYTSYLQSSLCSVLFLLDPFPLDIITNFALMEKGPIKHPSIPINDSKLLKKTQTIVNKVIIHSFALT